MALEDLSFKCWQLSDLTIPLSVLYLEHENDLSDNPKDSTFYFGSTAAATQLQASSNPGVDDIVLTPVSILPVWTAEVALTAGYTAKPTASNNRRYEITTDGTTDTTEPTWPTAIGSSVVDGTAVWTCVSETHEPTEIKLALTSGGLDTATAGAGLVLGNTILSGTANKLTIYARAINTVTTIESNADIGLSINGVVERAQ